MMRILTEASGSITSGYLFRAIQELGHEAVASDISDQCYAKGLTQDFILMPKVAEVNSWETTIRLVKENNINLVIPSLDETLLLWSQNKKILFEKDIYVIVSEPDTINICQDKWKTYLFFKENDIPTPLTSLEPIYPLFKPRNGRGSSGIYRLESKKHIQMDGYLSQEIIEGTEYTVDVFCDSCGVPVYIVPRKRLDVKEGKSTKGIVVRHPLIEKYVKEICCAIKFNGPINIQCFEEKNGEIKFIEINPRIAGGMALGFAATENWVQLIVNHFVNEQPIESVPVKYGLKMMRYYNEVFSFE